MPGLFALGGVGRGERVEMAGRLKQMMPWRDGSFHASYDVQLN
jgi:hypothetical protein